ncbi:hypothetical protein CSC04_4746 [Enterobacter roggenkampii]|nr:hypothetical protein CSC04_4746 [Enterobacter roggenkampii]
MFYASSLNSSGGTLTSDFYDCKCDEGRCFMLILLTFLFEMLH